MTETEKAVIETRLTQATQKLTSQEMALLYEDIFKPLDVFSILSARKRRREENTSPSVTTTTHNEKKAF